MIEQKELKLAVRNSIDDEYSASLIVEILKISNPFLVSPNGSPYNEGLRCVGNHILDWVLEYAPEKYTELVQSVKN